MTSSSSVGIALMQEGISYMAGAEVPCLIVNVQRGGPGLGTIQPSQADYMQATRGGGNGDYNLIVLAPNSVQEMADFVGLGFDLAFKYRIPVIMLADGVIGQMMEKVVLQPQQPRRTNEEIARECPWASLGKPKGRDVNVITSLELQPEKMEERNIMLQKKYRTIEENEVRYELLGSENPDVAIIAFGCSSRISKKVIQVAAEEGIQVALLRPITLWPFPKDAVRELSQRVRSILVVENNAGQMLYDVKLAVEGRLPVEHYGRFGGIIPTPQEILDKIKTML